MRSRLKLVYPGRVESIGVGVCQAVIEMPGGILIKSEWFYGRGAEADAQAALKEMRREAWSKRRGECRE